VQRFLSNDPRGGCVDISCSPKSSDAIKSLPYIKIVNLKKDIQKIIDNYELVISIHCKQLFPNLLHSNIECINIHPGINPETRGWFPQTWAILHNLNAGITVHRIDDALDHGDIIARVYIKAHKWDTSESLYKRIIAGEIRWIEDNLYDLIQGNYTCLPAELEGNLFLKSDFDNLCRLDLTEHASFENFYNRLRSLSFEAYKNAYFIDPVTGHKIYLELRITVDESG
jgi:methionyl-tRNA formyltransferase